MEELISSTYLQTGLKGQKLPELNPRMLRVLAVMGTSL